MRHWTKPWLGSERAVESTCAKGQVTCAHGRIAFSIHLLAAETVAEGTVHVSAFNMKCL